MIKLHSASLRQLLALKASQRKQLSNSDSSHGVNDNHCPDFDLRALSMFIYLGLKNIAYSWYGYFPYSTDQKSEADSVHVYKIMFRN